MPVFSCVTQCRMICMQNRGNRANMREGTPPPPPLPLRYTIRVQLLCPLLHVVYVLSPRSRCWRKLCRETGGGGTGGGVRRLLRQPLRRLRLRLPWQQPLAEQAGHGGKVLFGGGRRRKKERTPSLPFPLPPPPPCLYHGGRKRKELE